MCEFDGKNRSIKPFLRVHINRRGPFKGHALKRFCARLEIEDFFVVFFYFLLHFLCVYTSLSLFNRCVLASVKSVSSS